MNLNANGVLGIAMGTSEAGGYVDTQGNITGWLNELAFVPVDFCEDAMEDEWSGDYGCGVKYFSQDAVIKLAPAAGIELDPSLSPAEKLKVVQKHMEEGHEGAKAIYDESKLEGKDAYEFFLSGNQPLVTIKNPLLKDGSRLIIFRDSYASSISPLLAEAYSEIVLIDLRYISSDLLAEYVNFDNANILFLYSATMMNSSLALK
jgi:hypothetical protein